MPDVKRSRSIPRGKREVRKLPSSRKKWLRLGAVAHARSGDKGNSANIAVFADTASGYDFLRRELTAERVAGFLCGIGATRIERYEVPNLEALNFVLHHALGGGGSRSLRIDAQGKALGQALLELELPVPDNGPDQSWFFGSEVTHG